MNSKAQSAYTARQTNDGVRTNTENTGTPRITLNPEKIPQALRDICQWVVWRAKPRKGKPGKFEKKPVAPHPLKGGTIRAGTTIAHSDPESWLTFEQATAFAASPPVGVKVSGIGLSLSSDLGVSAIDLDDCFDEERNLKPHHRAIVDELDSYTELSPSGNGLHIFVLGHAPGRANNRDHGVEIYPGPTTQFITVTGSVYEGRSQMHPDPQDEYLAELYERYGAKASPKVGTKDGKHFGQPMPVYDPNDCRSLEELVEEGVLTEAWATLIRTSDWDSDQYRKKDGTIDRSRALYALALRMAADGGTAAEFKWHGCDNRDNAITDCPQSRSNPEHWFWRNCGDHVEWGKEENVLAYFEDLTQKNEEEMQSVQLPVLSMLRPKVLNAGNVADFLGKEIPPRPWLLHPLLLSGYITVGFAPGGVGKSVVSMALAATLVTGHDLIGVGKPEKPVNVLVLNNEDDDDELERRFQAILLKHGIDAQTLKAAIHFQSGYAAPLKIARASDDGHPTPTDVAVEIARYCLEHDIGAVFLDPLVSLHNAEENDNGAMEAVAAIFRALSAKTKAALHIVAHTRKLNNGKGSDSYVGDMDVLRGASSIPGAVRVGYTVARVSPDNADKLGIPPSIAPHLLRLDLAKGNFAPRPEDALAWIKLEEQHTWGGRDSIGVPIRYDIQPHVNAAENRSAAEHAAETAKKRAAILDAFGGNAEAPLTSLLPTLECDWNLEQRQTRELVNKYVPDGEERAVIVDRGDLGPKLWLWREKRGSPIFICTKPVKDVAPEDKAGP